MPWTPENNLKLLLTIMASSTTQFTPDWDKVAEVFGPPNTRGSLQKQFSRIKQMAENGTLGEKAIGTPGKSCKHKKDATEEVEQETPSKKAKTSPEIKNDYDELTIGFDG